MNFWHICPSSVGEHDSLKNGILCQNTESNLSGSIRTTFHFATNRYFQFGLLWQNVDNLIREEFAMFFNKEQEQEEKVVAENTPVRSQNIMVDGVSVAIHGLTDVTEKEIRNYIQMVEEAHGREELRTLSIKAAEDGKVSVDYTYQREKFERIRRITGYLVGSTDRWNNAKRAEEKERVKHTARNGR